VIASKANQEDTNTSCEFVLDKPLRGSAPESRTSPEQAITEPIHVTPKMKAEAGCAAQVSLARTGVIAAAVASDILRWK